MKTASRKAGNGRKARYYRILSQLSRLTEGERRRIAEACLRMNGVEIQPVDNGVSDITAQ